MQLSSIKPKSFARAARIYFISYCWFSANQPGLGNRRLNEIEIIIFLFFRPLVSVQMENGNDFSLFGDIVQTHIAKVEMESAHTYNTKPY